MKIRPSWNPLVYGSGAMLYGYMIFSAFFGYVVTANLAEGRPDDAIRHGLTLIAFLGILWGQQRTRKSSSLPNMKLDAAFLGVLILLCPLYIGAIWLLPGRANPEVLLYAATPVRLICIAYLSGLLYFFVSHIIRRDFHAR